MENNFQEIESEKTDEEMLNMVYQFDFWDAEMLIAVEKELEKRHILPDDIKERKQELIIQEDEILSQGKAATFGGQALGWFGVFGVLGLIIGYNYLYSKTTSKYTNKEYYTYDKDTRNNGSYIFYISLMTHVLFILYKLGNMYNL